MDKLRNQIFNMDKNQRRCFLPPQVTWSKSNRKDWDKAKDDDKLWAGAAAEHVRSLIHTVEEQWAGQHDKR